MLPPPVQTRREPRLADRLEATRRGRFVGRAAEFELFRGALLLPEPPFAVLHIFGPGGVGKTALLREFARIGAECGRPVIHLDGRNVDASPQGFRFAVRRALNQTNGAAPTARPEWPPAAVWLIDTFEALSPLDPWLRETFLPQLPSRSLVVIAGRDPPASAWSTELDWAGLTRVVALRNLQPAESQTYLAPEASPKRATRTCSRSRTATPWRSRSWRTCSIAATPWPTFDPQSDPDVVRALLERLIRDVPTPQHRRALEVCVLARVTTEESAGGRPGRARCARAFRLASPVVVRRAGTAGHLPARRGAGGARRRSALAQPRGSARSRAAVVGPLLRQHAAGARRRAATRLVQHPLPQPEESLLPPLLRVGGAGQRPRRTRRQRRP